MTQSNDFLHIHHKKLKVSPKYSIENQSDFSGYSLIHIKLNQSGLQKFFFKFFSKLGIHFKIRISTYINKKKQHKVDFPLIGFQNNNILFFDFFSNWFPIRINNVNKGNTVKFLIKMDPPLISRFIANVLISNEISHLEQDDFNIKKLNIFLAIESFPSIQKSFNNGLISKENYLKFQYIFKDFHIDHDVITQTDWTFPAVFSYHTGLSLNHHRMFHSERIKQNQDILSKNISTLAELFKSRGYFTSSGSLGKTKMENGFANGFIEYFKPESSLGFRDYSADDKWVIKQILKHGTNQYLHIHLDKLHFPLFTMAGNWNRVESSDIFNLISSDNISAKNFKSLFNSNLSILLDEISNIISFLKNNNLYEHTNIIITGDHGKEPSNWIDIKQVDPLVPERLETTYISNNPPLSDNNKNASIKAFFEFIKLNNLELPKYFQNNIQELNIYLDKLQYAEAVLKDNTYLFKIYNNNSLVYQYSGELLPYRKLPISCLLENEFKEEVVCFLNVMAKIQEEI